MCKKTILVLLLVLTFSLIINSNIYATDDAFEIKAEADKYFSEGNYKKAVNLYSKVLNYKDLDSKIIAIVNYKMGRCYEFLNEIDLSIKYYYNSLKINKELLNYSALMVIYFRLGTQLENRNDIDKAIISFENAFSISQAIGNKTVNAHCSFKIGLLYYVLEKNGQSLRYFMKSLKYHTSAKNYRNTGIISYYIGNIYYDEGRKEDALKIWKLSMYALKKAGSDEWKIVEETIKSIEN